MAPPTVPRIQPIKICFVDISGQIFKEGLITTQATYPRLLTLLTELSSDVIEYIHGITTPLLPRQGFTSSHGAWWYRVVKQGYNFDAQLQQSTETNIGEWKIMDSSAAFDRLLAEMTLGIDTAGAWVEFQHVRHCHPFRLFHLSEPLANYTVGRPYKRTEMRLFYDKRKPYTAGSLPSIQS